MDFIAGFRTNHSPLSPPPIDRPPTSSEVGAASSSIQKAINTCIHGLTAAETTHTKLLIGDPGTTGNIDELVKNLDQKVMEARTAVHVAKQQYGSYDSGKVQQLLVRAETRLQKLQKIQEQVKVWGSPAGMQVLRVKHDVQTRLDSAYDKKNNPADLLLEAQQILNEVSKDTHPPLLRREIEHLQARLIHQANKQLALNSREKHEVKNYSKKTSFGNEKRIEKKSEVLETLSQKTFVRTFITGKQEPAAWSAAKAFTEQSKNESLADLLGQSEKSNKTEVLETKNTESFLARFIRPETGVSTLIKDMEGISKSSFKLQKQMTKMEERMLTHPSETIATEVFQEIHEKTAQLTARLAICEDRLDKLAASKKNLSRVPDLQRRRAVLQMSLTSLRAEKEAVEGLVESVQGLKRHKAIQQLFSTLRKVKSSSKIEKNAAKTLAAADFEIQVLAKDPRYGDLSKTLAQQLKAISGDAIKMTENKEKLLGSIKGEKDTSLLGRIKSSIRMSTAPKLTTENDFRRFGIILSKQAALALYGDNEAARGGGRENVRVLRQIMNTNLALREYIAADPKMAQLMRNYDGKFNVTSREIPEAPKILEPPQVLVPEGTNSKLLEHRFKLREVLSSERTYGSSIALASNFVGSNIEDSADITWRSVRDNETDSWNKELIDQFEQIYKQAVREQQKIEEKIAAIPFQNISGTDAKAAFQNLLNSPEFVSYTENLARYGVLYSALQRTKSSVQVGRSLQDLLGEIQMSKKVDGNIQHTSLSNALIEPAQRFPRWGLFSAELDKLLEPKQGSEEPIRASFAEARNRYSEIGDQYQKRLEKIEGLQKKRGAV